MTGVKYYMFRKRVLANVIDFLIFAIVIMIINVIPILDDYFISYNLNSVWYKIYIVCLMTAYLGFFCKDIQNGQSIGKKITKLKVVNQQNNIPTHFQLVIRNITLFIWPIEIFLLLLGYVRIGERISKTRIIECL